MPAALARARPLVLPTQVFVGGAAVMALELLVSRVLAPHYGSTIYVWGSLIGVVMLALAAGASVGGRRADARPTLDAFSRVVLVAGLVTALVPTAAPWVLDGLGRLDLGIVWGPLAASLVLVAPPTFLLGMATPFAVRLTAERVERVGNVSGNVYALSTAGSIVGTFATTFVLIPGFRVPALFGFVGIALAAVAVAGVRERGRALAVAGIVLLASPVGLDVAGRVLVAPSSGIAGNVVFETDTAYHHIEVVDDYDVGSENHERALVMDGLKHSAMYTKRPNETSARYVHYFHLGMAANPDAQHVLFIGAGGFSGPKKFLEAYPNVTVDVVEIDAEVVRVAEEWFDAPTGDPRVRVFVEDGRRFLADADREYDLVVLDAYSRTYVPFHMMTAEFFFELHDRLAPGGVVVSNLIAATSGAASEILKAEVKTIDEAFGNVYAFPVRGAAFPLPQNVIVVATRDGGEALDEAAWRRAARDAATRHVPALESYAGSLWTGLDTYGAPLLRDDFSSIEMLLNPVTRQAYTGE